MYHTKALWFDFSNTQFDNKHSPLKFEQMESLFTKTTLVFSPAKWLFAICGWQLIHAAGVVFVLKKYTEHASFDKG